MYSPPDLGMETEKYQYSPAIGKMSKTNSTPMPMCAPGKNAGAHTMYTRA
jgi:hypothetical protein